MVRVLTCTARWWFCLHPYTTHTVRASRRHSVSQSGTPQSSSLNHRGALTHGREYGRTPSGRAGAKLRLALLCASAPSSHTDAGVLRPHHHHHRPGKLQYTIITTTLDEEAASISVTRQTPRPLSQCVHSLHSDAALFYVQQTRCHSILQTLFTRLGRSVVILKDATSFPSPDVVYTSSRSVGVCVCCGTGRACSDKQGTACMARQREMLPSLLPTFLLT